MQNPIQRFRQSPIVFEKPDILTEKWKLWRDLIAIGLNNSAKTLHAFPYYQYLQNDVRDCFNFV